MRKWEEERQQRLQHLSLGGRIRSRRVGRNRPIRAGSPVRDGEPLLLRHALPLRPAVHARRGASEEGAMPQSMPRSFPPPAPNKKNSNHNKRERRSARAPVGEPRPAARCNISAHCGWPASREWSPSGSRSSLGSGRLLPRHPASAPSSARPERPAASAAASPRTHSAASAAGAPAARAGPGRGPARGSCRWSYKRMLSPLNISRSSMLSGQPSIGLSLQQYASFHWLQ